MSRKVRGGFPFLTWIVLLLTSALQASEWGDFPASHRDLQPHFERYARESQRALVELDQMTASKESVDFTQWLTICRGVRLELLKAEHDAEQAYQKAGSGELPIAVGRWIAQEAQTWGNIETTGRALINLHTQIVTATTKIENELMPEYRTWNSWIQVTAKGLDQAIGEFTPSQHGEGTQNTNPQLESLVSRAIADTGRFCTGLQKMNQEIAEHRKKFKASDYPSKLDVLTRKVIDPDGKGVFLRHERTWESDLKSTLTQYETAYASYEGAVHTIESYELLYAYKNLREMPHKANEAIKWVEAKAKRAITPPKLEANDIRLTTNAIPRKMTVGEDQLLEVMVNNAGKAPLPAGWVVKCEVTQSPSGADPDGLEYTTGKGPEIPAGRGMRVRQGVKAPQGVGRWTLSWTLVSGSKTLAKAQANVELEGEAEAELGSTSTPRDIEQGRNGALTVNVKNTGNAPLAANNFNVHVKVRRAPNGYRATNKDFATILRSRNAVGPGAEARLQGALTPPADPKAVGDWQLELQLKVAGRVVESKTFSVRVKP